MDCKRLGEMILTDYLDDQISSEAKLSIDEHLKYCDECGDVARQIKKVIEPLERLDEKEPSLSIWNRIEASIQNEQLDDAPNIIDYFVIGLKSIIFPKKRLLVYATASCLLVFSMLILMPGKNQLVKNSGEEVKTQINALAYLIDFTQDEVDVSDGYGTFIEEYLLL